jgi:hypothetical protein
MRLRSGMPTSSAERVSSTESSYSWHTDHHLIASMARGGLFWSASVRLDCAGKPETQGSSDPEWVSAASLLVASTPPGTEGWGIAAAAVPGSTAIVEPLVMASLCELLYDDFGQTSKPDWSREQWNAALQQQPSTASWRFLSESGVNPQVYFGIAFENIHSGQIVIANRGTQTAHDLLVSDIGILKGIIPPAFLAAELFAAQVVAAHQGSGREIFVTGHSLGGADAQYQAATLGLGGSTFAALGARFAAAECAPNLVNYLYPQDGIANLAPHVGTVAYIQPNGPAQWVDLLVTRQYEGEGLHFINNYLEHFGAPGVAPITPVQFVEAVVLAEVVDFFCPEDAVPTMPIPANDLPRPSAANPAFGFGELAWPDSLSAEPSALSAPAGNGAAFDWPLAATLGDAVLSIGPPPPEHRV